MITTFTGEVHKIIQEISFNRDKIKEDFIKAYLSSIHPEQLTPVLFEKLTLVEEWSHDRTTVKWHLELKK